MRISEQGSGQPVRQGNIHGHLSVEGRVHLRVHPRGEGCEGRAESPGALREIHREPSAGIVLHDLSEKIPRRRVDRREDEFAGAGDGKGGGELLHCIDRMPDGEVPGLLRSVGGGWLNV